MFYNKIFDQSFEELAAEKIFRSDYKQFCLELAKSKAKIAGKPLPSLFHPLVISNNTFIHLCSEAEQMARILCKTVKLYFKYPEIRDFFNFSSTLQDWLSIPPGYEYAVPISRYDAFFDGTSFNFCEFNTDGTSGMNEVNTLEEIFLKTESGKYLRNKFSLRMLNLREATLNTLLKCSKEYGHKEVPNIAIVDFTESATIAEFEALQEYFIKKGVPTAICDARELEYRNGRLFCGNFRIDVIYRRAVTDEMLENKASIEDLIKAYKEGAVCMVGPLKSQIVHSKLSFAFLRSKQAEKYFAKEELNFIKKHVPWTARIKNDNLLFQEITNNKNKYILKPHNAYGGRGVYVGEDHKKDEWTKLVEKLMQNESNYLVQKKIAIPEKDFIVNSLGQKEKLKISMAPFVFNGKLSGFYTRASKIDIITTNRGGKVVPLFISH